MVDSIELRFKNKTGFEILCIIDIMSAFDKGKSSFLKPEKTFTSPAFGLSSHRVQVKNKIKGSQTGFQRLPASSLLINALQFGIPVDVTGSYNFPGNRHTLKHNPPL